MFNQTLEAASVPNSGSKEIIPIYVPISSTEPDYKLNNGSPYEVLVENIGEAWALNQTSHSLYPVYNNSATVKVTAYYPYVEETDHPYYYFGVAVLALAAITAVLPYAPQMMRKTKKLLLKEETKQDITISGHNASRPQTSPLGI